MVAELFFGISLTVLTVCTVRIQNSCLQQFPLDIMWWHSFLQSFNGKCQFFNKLPVVDVQTDACTIGVVAIIQW